MNSTFSWLGFLHQGYLCAVEWRRNISIKRPVMPNDKHIISRTTWKLVNIFNTTSSFLQSILLFPLDLSWISKIQVNQPAVLRRARQIQARRTVKKEWQVRVPLEHSVPVIYKARPLPSRPQYWILLKMHLNLKDCSCPWLILIIHIWRWWVGER